MIPIFGTAAVLVAPSAPLLSTGYVPGNTLSAQHLNWYLFHLTSEVNNVLTAQGMSQSTANDSQLLQAVGRTNSVISTSGAVITAAQFVGNALVQFTNASGSSNYLIGSGAARPGIEIIVEALSGSGVMIVNGSGSAFLGSGAVRLLWDGSQWCKIGGNAFLQTFVAGSGLTWITPWKGSYRSTVVGGGGGGGGRSGLDGSGGSGGGGGTAISVLNEAAGSILTYTVGGSANGGSIGSNPGTPGNNSVLSDGSSVLTGGGGAAGVAGTSYGTPGAAGGVATGGQINIGGSGGGGGIYSHDTQVFSISGNGGGSFFGGGAPGAGTTSSGNQVNGNNGTAYGGGGSGATGVSGTGSAGGNGAAGVIVIEF